MYWRMLAAKTFMARAARSCPLAAASSRSRQSADNPLIPRSPPLEERSSRTCGKVLPVARMMTGNRIRVEVADAVVVRQPGLRRHPIEADCETPPTMAQIELLPPR